MKAINKNIFREISKSRNRFMSIFTICAIGVGFFSGVKATPNDMKISADDYYDRTELFDLRVVSTFGLTDGDAEAIAQIEGVDAVYTSKYTDLAMMDGDDEYLTRVYSWNEDVNRLDIIEGREPTSENEIVISFNELSEGLKIGDTVSLVDLTEAEEFPLYNSEYTIVGMFESPMYIALTQRGSTTIGNGSLDVIAYTSESNFTQEIYTEIYVRSDELTELRSYDDEYEQLCDDITEKLEQLGVNRSEIRYEEVVGEALLEIADGEKELEEAKLDGEKELADAKKELDDAAEQIADGEQELLDAKKEIEDGKKQLDEAKQELADAKQQLDDGKRELKESKDVLTDAEKQLSDSKLEIDKGQQELSKAKSELDKSKTHLEDGQTEIDNGHLAITEGLAQIEQARAELNLAKDQYLAGLEQYNSGRSEYEAGLEQFLQAEQLYGKDNPIIVQQRVELEQAKAELEQSKLVLDQTALQLENAEQELFVNEQVIKANEEQLALAQQTIDEGWSQYNEGVSQYEQALKEFEDGKAKYLAGLDEYLNGLSQYNEGLKAIEDGQAEYDEGMALYNESLADYNEGVQQYEDGVKEIEDAKVKYADGLKEYEDGKQTFYEEIADAEKELADAREKIADAGKAEWYIFSRTDNPGYAEYESNAERIAKIASIFPVFFLLVAGLVCLTTMSRMVEEQRTHIGTLKALGYSRGVIMRHYMIYALSAAAVGSLLGAGVGMFLFPKVIIYAYSMMYNISDITYQLTPDNLITSAGLMLLAIGLMVFFSCNKALQETPASLMRPKAPKAGKRVLIEKIPALWNRMSFFGKVSGRNLFRYKRRMFMTVIGIAGCTALSFTGFGLKDSVSDIVNLQYNSIYNYSGSIVVDDEIADDELETIYRTLDDYGANGCHTLALLKQYTLVGEGGRADCYVTAVEDSEIFQSMVVMRERVSEEPVTMADGAVATEKLAKLLGVEKGDTVTIQISDGVERKVTITGITEHYTSHYLYLTEAQYTELFGNTPAYNMVYFRADIGDSDLFSEDVMKNDGVLTVMLNSGASDSFNDMIKMLDLVIIVLIVSAGALAFVVLYNLTNVNICERIREIATLKVLGFYDREVSSYVFRENVILSLMGGVVGLGLGYVLCHFVIATAEIDEVMFGRNIYAPSYILAFVITAVFSLIVNQLMKGTLKKISMVESLKSVE